MSARAALALALALASLVLAPLAAADHVFSHRVYVVGRVVGADGVPVAGAEVRVEFSNVESLGGCLGRADEPTGPQGDFRICRHVHAMPAERGATARIEVQGETFDAAVDERTRRAVAHIVLEAPAGSRDIGGERLFNRTVRVDGAVFFVGGGNVEGVDVAATAMPGRLVHVRLVTESGVLVVESNDTTDDVGEYTVELATTELPPGARIHVRYENETRESALDARLRRADVDILLDPAAPGGDGDPGVARPGTGDVRVPAPPLAWGAAALAASALAAAPWARSRRRG